MDYVYFSSFSRDWITHARDYAEAISAARGLDSTSMVIEIGSNDGYLLQHFVEHAIPVLGIEPAPNVAVVSRAAGIPVEQAFFDAALARTLSTRRLSADLVIANNVMAHVPTIADFLEGVRILLKPSGAFTAEVPHLLRLIEQTAFDTIYHEHYFYFSLLVLEPMFREHGLRIFDVEELATHGGSLRIHAVPAAGTVAEGPGLQRVREAERRAGLDNRVTYAGFAEDVESCRRAFREFLDHARAEQKRVAGVGAAAKGNVLLNHCGVSRDEVGFVADETPAKIGKFLPGTRIPVVPLAEIEATRPDYVVILPWNHKDELLRKLRGLADWRGQAVLAVPTLQVIDLASS